MGFFSNKSINYLNISNSFFELMSQISNVFVAVFLYKQGFSITKIFIVLALIFGMRILMRFITLPILAKLGLRKTIMLGLVGNGISILNLSLVEGIDGWLVSYILMFALFNSMYWLCFHIFYTLSGEEKHRGKQYAMRSAFILSLQAIFPLISGFVIEHSGYGLYFALSIPITILGLIPLFKCPDIKNDSINFKLSKEIFSYYGVKTGILWSFYDAAVTNSWFLIILMFFAGKVTSFGGILSFGIIVQVLWQLLIGRHIDAGKKRIFAIKGGIIIVLVLFCRSFLELSLTIVIALELMFAIGKLNLLSVRDVEVYNNSHKSHNVMQYWIFTEIARDAGNVLGYFSVALLLQSGLQIREAMLVALPALITLIYIVSSKKSSTHS
ncbi:MAG: MFS transporter [Pseudomonadota bacterium]